MRWIVVDGIDGSGKSTQARWIREYYEKDGQSVVLFIHPSSRWMGRMTRRALLGHGKMMRLVASVFFMLDVLLSLSSLKRSGDCHDTVIFVRYVMATAYLPSRLSRRGYAFFSKVLPVPRRKLLVDIDPSIALRRISLRDHGREMFENLPSLIRIRERMLDLAGEAWEVIDNSGTEEDSLSRLRSIMNEWDEGG